MEQSFKVASTIAAYRVVAALTGTANTVALPATGFVLPFGITKDSVLDTNEAIRVAGPGEIAKLYFANSCASGAFVGFNTSGEGIAVVQGETSTAVSGAAGVIGVLLGPKVEAAGTIADVYILPTIVRAAK